MAKPRENSYATKRDVLCEKLTRHVSPRTDRVSSELEIFNGDREVRDNRDGWIVLSFLPFLFFFSFLFSFLRREGQRNDYCLYNGDFMEAKRLEILYYFLWRGMIFIKYIL